MLAFDSHPYLTAPRAFGDGGIRGPRVSLQEWLNQVIIIEVNRTETIGDLPQSDADVAVHNVGQVFRTHVIEGEVFPLAFVTLHAARPFQENAGAENVLECGECYGGFRHGFNSWSNQVHPFQ